MKRKLALSVLCGGLLTFVAVANPVRGQSPPPPPPPAPGGPPGAPCPPTGCPTNTPTVTPIPPTATPTATATATPTATAVPCFVSLKLSHSTVKAGSKQKASATSVPGATVKITVKFPNNKKKSKGGSAGTNGGFSYQFTVPKNAATAKSKTATVTANATCANQAPVKATKKYKIT